MSRHPMTAKQRRNLHRTLVMMLAGVPKEERMARHASVEANYRARKARLKAAAQARKASTDA